MRRGRLLKGRLFLFSIHRYLLSLLIRGRNVGLLDWIENKIKTRDYLNSSNPADVRNQLVSATNVVKDFENPSIDEEKVRAYGNNNTRFSRKMGEAKAQLADMKYGETVRMDALNQAKAMFQNGDSMDVIFNQTRWKLTSKGWRYNEPIKSVKEKFAEFVAKYNSEKPITTSILGMSLSEAREVILPADVICFRRSA